MAENSGIEWTDHTFNPWIGCTKVSPACDNCYAERLATGRMGREWGPHAERRRTKTWGNPVKWNRQAEAEGRRYRVFCASLADVFDNHKSIEWTWRHELLDLILRTPHLDWLLLTKRPQNVRRYVPGWCDPGVWPKHVWLGTTVENQAEANRRIPHLLRVPAATRFLSCEPLLGPVDLTRINDEDTVMIDALRGQGGWPVPHGEAGPARLHWVITGGESGPNYRPADPDWFRSLRDQCAEAEVPFLFKQWEGKSPAAIKKLGRELDGVVHDGYPAAA